MAVKLRFVRIGKKNHPAYRLCAIESRKARDGQYLENLGFYDPYIADDKKKIRIDRTRAEYWLRVGAQPSQTVLDFFKKEKISGLIRPGGKGAEEAQASQEAEGGSRELQRFCAQGRCAGQRLNSGSLTTTRNSISLGRRPATAASSTELIQDSLIPPLGPSERTMKTLRSSQLCNRPRIRWLSPSTSSHCSPVCLPGSSGRASLPAPLRPVWRR
jgi:ribosomal protein S16